MPDVSKIRLPGNTEVNIKDSRISGVDTTPTSGSENVVTSGGVFASLRTDKIAPIETHTYSNILTNTTYVTSGYILFQAKPIVWDEPVLVRYRMRIYVDGHEDLYYSKNECVFALFHDTVSAYSCKNYIGNTSYRTIYYHSLYRCKAGYEDIGHLFGFCYYNAGASYSRNCTTSGYGRTFVVEILEADNCTITWPDTCDIATGISGYVADTSHFARADYNATTQGETHSGDANTNTVAYYIRTPSATKVMDGAMYRYRMVFTSMDGKKWIPANTSTSTNATSLRDVNQTPFNPFGEIAYYYTTTAVANGVAPAAGNIWRQYELTLGYSFNRTGAALVLTYPAPIYLKCAPQSDGSAIIDADTPYVQTLPSSSDGKIYIFLGMSYSATNITLMFDHPIYYHDGTRIRLWTDAKAPVSPGTLNTTATTAQSTSSSESLSGSVILHKVAKTGTYSDLIGKPTIPSAPGTLNTTATTAQSTSSSEALSGNITLHKVAKTGTYSDLVGKPTVDSSPTASSSNLVSSGGVYTALQNILSQIVSFDSVSSPQDGTLIITLSNGDTITVDLNHSHPQYPKYEHLASESSMPTNPDVDTMYLIDGGGGGGASIVYLTDESQMPANPDANTLYVILESQS